MQQDDQAPKTDSERYLSELCNRTFLKLWSYHNPYFKHNDELCDVLCVFGDDVVVFSDKHIKFRSDIDIELAWSRWQRKAITKSAGQLSRARNWIRSRPNEVYLDPHCTLRLPVNIPTGRTIRIHCIATARGASEASKEYRDYCRGSLAQASNATWLANAPPLLYVHDQPRHGFFHLFDSDSLEFVLSEFDTAPDFVRYLRAKERLFRRKTTIVIPGEDDLAAFYISDSAHPPHRRKWNKMRSDICVIEDHQVEELKSREGYVNSKLANRISYYWDSMIDRLSTLSLDETGATVKAPAAEMEEGLRILAAEDRFSRRGLVKAMASFIDSVSPTSTGRRRFVSRSDPTVIYVIQLWPAVYPDETDWWQWRQARREALRLYCYATLEKHRECSRCVGIATEAGWHAKGRSEDLVVTEAPDWTPEKVEEVRLMRDELGFLQDDRVKYTHTVDYEFPVRSQTETAVGKIGRNQPCVCGSGLKYKKCCGRFVG